MAISLNSSVYQTYLDRAVLGFFFKLLLIV